MKSNLAKILLAPAFAAVLFYPFSASAQSNYSWSAAGNGTWSTPANWTPNGTPGGNSGDTATIASGTTGSVMTFDASSGSTTTIAGLTLASPYVLTFDAANSKTLVSTGILDVDGALVLRGSSSNQTLAFTYSGTTLSASTGKFVIDNDNSGSSGRDFTLTFTSTNTNGATMIAASRNANAGQNSQSAINLTGSGTFTNAASISLYSDRGGTNNDVSFSGSTATVVQTGAAAVFRMGGTDAGVAKTADVVVASLQIHDGTLAGNGEIRSAGGILIGNGDGVSATLAVNPLSISGQGTSASVTTGNGISSLNLGYQGGVASTVTNLTLNSDAIVQMQLAPSNATADLIALNGNLSIDANATLSLTLFGSDAVLAGGAKFLLIDYTGSWNATGFNGLADGSTFVLGLNQYRIDYDGNFSNGAFSGGTDVMVTVVPEPQTLLCFLMGAAALLGIRRRVTLP